MSHQNILFKKDLIKIRQVSCSKEIKKTIKDFIDSSNVDLPQDKNASILIKPNLNNDLNALTGNSSDLRIIAGTVEALKSNGFSNITIADGSNVGIDRRNIDTLKRLRIDRLASYYNVKILNLNKDKSSSHNFPTGSIDISESSLNADFFIVIPKIKTHGEAAMSLAVKNLMGCIVGQQKRKMHESLSENLVRVNEILKPDLYIIDGLIAMEGNGPGDGIPKQLGLTGAGKDPFLIDLAFAKLLGFKWDKIEYLKIASDKGHFTEDDIKVAESLTVIDNIKKAPKRAKLAELSESRFLYWLKLLVRPIVALRPITKLAYRFKIIQDIYCLEDDSIEKIEWDSKKCSDSCKTCDCFCPTDFKQITADVKEQSPNNEKFDLTTSSHCIGCLYCYFVCPEDAITITGNPGFLKYHIEKYQKVTKSIGKTVIQ